MIARLAGATLAAGALAGAVVAAQVLPGSRTATPVAATLPVVASAAVPVCPGPETRQVPDGAVAEKPGGPTVAGAVVAAAGMVAKDGSVGLARPVGGSFTAMIEGSDGPVLAGSGGAGGAGGAGGTTLTGAPGRAAVAASVQVNGPGPRRLDVVRPAAASASAPVPVLGATQVTLSRTGDLRGLSAVGCGVATTDTWLVGGGTGDGRRARLLLANPAASPAVVDVAVHGPDGPVDAPGGRGVVVPAGGQVALLVDALAPGLDSLAVHVTTRSGRVVAELHDELLRGLVAGGTDAVTGSAAPATTQVVPGVVVSARWSGPGGLPDDPRAAGATAVRVAVPGRQEAVVKVSLLGPDGPVDVTDSVRTVAAGAVVDVPLTDVDNGTYAAVVTSDVPVVASVLVGRTARPDGSAFPTGASAGPGEKVVEGDQAPADLAWAASADPVRGLLAVARPPVDGVGAVLVLSAVTASAATVVLLDADGAPLDTKDVDLAAGTTGSVVLPETAAGLLVRARQGDVRAGLVLTTSDARGPMISVPSVHAGSATTTGRPRTVAEDPSAGLVP